MPNSFTIPVRTAFTLTWTLTDAQGNPINNATVTATLYAGRSASNPTGTPGTAISPVNNVVLPYVPGSAGQYSVGIPATVDPPLDGTGYTIVIDASIAGTPIYHNEQPAVVETAGSQLDLTTLDQVKNWIPQMAAAGDDDDAVIQACITAWGFEFLQRTGLGNQNGDLLQSPFNAICSFNETYNGGGTHRLYLRNRPVRTVSALFVNGVQIPQSTAYAVRGWVVDANARSIMLRAGSTGFGGSYSQTAWQAGAYRSFGGGSRFPSGVQNINVLYTAGYSNTPADIVQCANKVVHLNYKRRGYVDERSRAMSAGGGTIAFQAWDIPPECQMVIERYMRTL